MSRDSTTIMLCRQPAWGACRRSIHRHDAVCGWSRDRGRVGAALARERTRSAQTTICVFLSILPPIWFVR